MMRLITAYLLLLITVTSYSQMLDLVDFSSELYSYDSQNKEWNPYFLGSSAENIVGFEIENGYYGYNLKFCENKGVSLFLNGKLLLYKNNSGCEFFKMSRLKELSNGNMLFLVIYAPNGLSEMFSAKLTKPLLVENAYTPVSVPKSGDALANFTIIAGIFMLLILTLIYNLYPKHFSEFYNFRRVLSLKIREQNILTAKPLSPINLAFLFFHSVLIAYVFVLLSQTEFSLSYSHLLTTWIKSAIIVFGFIATKYLVLTLMGVLFRLKGFTLVHFYDFISMSKYYFFIVLLVLVVVVKHEGKSTLAVAELALISFILFSIIRMSYVLVKALRATQYRFMHLFAYLCTTEIFPLVILVKWA